MGVTTRSLRFVDGPSSHLLLPPADRHLGARDRATTEPGSIRIEDMLEIRVADQPIVRRLKDFMEEAGVPKEIRNNTLLFDEYDIWLIVHTVGVIERQRSGITIAALGYRAQLAKGAATLGMLPSQVFIERFKASASVGVEGNLELPTLPLAATRLVESWGGQANLKVSSEANLFAALDLSVKTPLISTVGLGRSDCEWNFRKASEPLLGDHVMVQTVRVPSGTESVEAGIVAYAQIRNWFEWTLAPRLIWTEEVELTLTPASRS